MKWILGLALLLPGLSVAQMPSFSDWPPDLKDHFGVAGEILDHALRYRAVPVHNFSFKTINTGWSFKILKETSDTFIVTYTPPDIASFYVQAIICEEGDKAHLYDATVLGPTETGTDFYKDNADFLSPDLNSGLVKCFSDAHIMGEISQGETSDPKIGYFTSPDRAIRHLCYWARYFRTIDGKRAADYMVTALNEEKTLIQQMESKQEYQVLSHVLNMADQRLPVENLDPSLPFDKAQRADVRSWLETTIRIRGKLKLFLPGADARIAQDQALLARFR